MSNLPPTPPPLPFLNNGITQVALLVEDLDRTVENYWRLFGIGPWHFYTYKRPLLKFASYRGQPVDHSFRIALSYCGPTRIELIAMEHGDSVYAEFVQKHGYGVQHFGLLVDDMQAALAQARAAGWTVLMEGGGFGPDGDGHYAYLDTEEALGVTLELIQRPKRRYPPEKVYPPEEPAE